MTTRRDFIRNSTLAGGALGLGLASDLGATGVEKTSEVVSSSSRTPHPLNILVLGGTSFLGPHLIRYALDRGHSVTTFTRGQTLPAIYKSMYRHVEQLTGDRAGDHSALEGRRWDVVMDNSGMNVDWVRTSADLLSDSGVYVFTSSTGVYLPYYGTDLREDREVLLEDPPEVPEDRRPSYGVMKSISENIIRDVFGPERAIIVRPTYIVGPADTQISRFPYWPVRMRRGGKVLVPGLPDDRVQYIDVRDLTEWMVRLAESETAGTFNVAGPPSPMTMPEFVHGIRAATSSEVEWVHVTDYDFLRENRVGSMLPWLMPTGEYEGSARINIEHSKANGLTLRSLAESTVDVLDWWDSDAVTDEQRSNLIDGERGMMRREADIIAAWEGRPGQ